MSTENVMTPAEAREWVNSREWANGWNVNVDDTVDAVEFATQYHRNKPLWDKLFKFLAEHDPMTLEPGKIELEKGRVWINVPEEYTPKSAEDTALRITASLSTFNTLSWATSFMVSLTPTRSHPRWNMTP